MKRTWKLLLLAAAVLVPAWAQGALIIDVLHDGEPQRIYLTERMFSGATSEGQVIYRGDRDVLWIVNAVEGTWTEVSREDAERIGRTIDEATARMQEMLRQLPPEQREAAEKAMGAMAGRADTPLVVAPTGESRTIHGFATSGYTVTSADGSVSEVWAAPLEELGLVPEDLAVLGEFADFTAALMSSAGEFTSFVKDYAADREGEVPGVPVLTVHRDAEGRETFRTELVSVERTPDIPAEVFELPEGLRKQEFLPGR